MFTPDGMPGVLIRNSALGKWADRGSVHHKDEFTHEGKLKRDLAKQEQQKIIEINEKKEQTLQTFRENLEMLKMNLKVYDKKEE